jgi:hypothetical protein
MMMSLSYRVDFCPHFNSSLLIHTILDTMSIQSNDKIDRSNSNKNRRTTITLPVSVRDKLAMLGGHDDTFQDIINRLILVYNNAQKKNVLNDQDNNKGEVSV